MEPCTKQRDDLARAGTIAVEFGSLAKQWAIGDTSPSEVKRKVNPLLYQDGRHRAIPAISQERLGYVMWTNAGSSSRLTIQDLDRIAKSFPWGNGLTLHLPVDGGGSFANYSDSLVVYEESLNSGFRVPLVSFMSQLLSAMDLSPAKVTPNSWFHFNAFAYHCVSKGFYPTYDQVCMLFECLETEGGVLNFYTSNTNLIQTPKSANGWRERWFLVKQRDEYSFGFPLYSKKPKSFPKNVEGSFAKRTKKQKKIEGSQRQLLKTVLELPLPFKLVHTVVITDDNLEFAGISYPFERPAQYVVENVVAATAGVEKKAINVVLVSEEPSMEMGESREICTKKRDDLSRVIDEGMDVKLGALVKQWVIEDTPSSEVKRRVNPLLYQDGRHCAIPAISHERLGYEEGTNAGSSSILTVAYLDWLAKNYPWGNGLTLHLPVEGGGFLANYPGSVVVHEDSLVAGFRIPLAHFMSRLLSTMELSPARVSPNSWKYFSAFAHHCVDKGFYPEYDQVCMLFHRGECEDGVFNFKTSSPTNLTGPPNYVYRWRERWFLVRQSDEYTFGFPRYSKEPKDFPKYKLDVSQKNLLMNLLGLPIDKKFRKVITDDILESTGICYPFKRTNQYAVENVDDAAKTAKKKATKNLESWQRNGKRVAAEVPRSKEGKGVKRTRGAEKPANSGGDSSSSGNSSRSWDDGQESSGPSQMDAVFENVTSALQLISRSQNVGDISSIPLQSLLHSLDLIRSQTVPMTQYEKLKKCFNELLEEIACMQVQVLSQSGLLLSKEKEMFRSKAGVASSTDEEKEKALSVLDMLMKKFDTAVMDKVNADNQVKQLQRAAEQRELQVQAMAEDNSWLLETVQELTQDNVTLHEKLTAAGAKGIAEHQLKEPKKEFEPRQSEVQALTEETTRLRKMIQELSQNNSSLRKVLKEVKAEIAQL